MFGIIAVNNEEANESIDETNDKAKKAGQSFDDMSEDAEKSEGKLGKAFQGIGKAAVAFGKAVVAGIGVASGVIAKLGKDAIEQYGNYEQLVGGVETLFKDSADIVVENASQAYKTAGLSANEYMETVTGFSAALLQSVGGDTVKAANMADMAITDMSDNANKMGSDIEAIKTAYSGFARGQYQLLDNLKLGYGGTKEEMQRLLDDAEKLSGVKYDLSSYADIVEAIHVVQTEMGITGTTAQEASTTIQGSLASAKAAWTNLLTGLTDENADLEALINNLFESIMTVGDNLIPRITNVLSGVSTLVERLVPKIAEQIPGLLSTLLPGLVSGAVGLLNSLVKSLPQILEPLMAALPQLLSGIEQIFYSLTAALPDLLQILADALPVLIPQLVTAVVNMVVFLMGHINEFLQPVIDALPSIIEAVLVALFSNLPQLLEGCVRLIGSLFDAIIQLLDGLLGMIFDPIFKWLGDFFRDAWTAVSGFFSDIWDAVSEAFGKAAKWVYDTIVKPVADFFKGLWEGIVSAFHTVIDPWIEIIKRASKIVYDAVIKPVLDYFKKLWDDICAIWETVSGWFNEHVIEPVKNLFADIWNSIKEKAADAWEGIKNAFKPVADWFHNIFSNAWQKVKEVFSTGGKVFDGIKEGIENTFKTVVNAIIGGINKIIAVPFGAINKILEKIHSIEILGVSPFEWVHTFEIPEMPLLAKGGIVDRPTQIIAGEAGAEAIVPLEHNTEWIRRVVTEIETTTSSSDAKKLIQMLLDEFRMFRRDLYDIILAALRTNSDDFDGSERDFIRLVKKYAFA